MPHLPLPFIKLEKSSFDKDSKQYVKTIYSRSKKVIIKHIEFTTSYSDKSDKMIKINQSLINFYAGSFEDSLSPQFANSNSLSSSKDKILFENSDINFTEVKVSLSGITLLENEALRIFYELID